MKIRYIYSFLLASLFLWSACSEAEIGTGDGAGAEILLSATGEDLIVQKTRAVDVFPNDGSIGVFAATQYTPATSSVDAACTWYDGVNNAKATWTSYTTGKHLFDWETKRYFPFNDNPLHFMAYAPHTAAASGNYFVKTVAGNPELNITLQRNTPDILYTLSNAHIAYTKSSNEVYLGEFEHMLSKLVVSIQLPVEYAARHTVKSLSVESANGSGVFRFVKEASQRLDVNNAPVLLASLANNKAFNVKGIVVDSLLLFPGTEGNTKIKLELEATNENYVQPFEFLLTDFKDNSNVPVTLEQGRRAVATVNVELVPVANPGDPNSGIHLYGQLTDWNDMGNFIVKID